LNNLFINKKILFWVIFILSLSLRLLGITNELNDYHHFRQTYTAAFAKYFYENNNSLFNPNLDILNYKNVSEFQIYPYIVSLFYKLFGFKDFIGRLVSVFFSMMTLVLYYKLLKNYFNQSIALIGITFFGMMPLSVYYGRVFMLEPMMLFLSVSMIYTFSKYLDKENSIYLFLSIFSTALTLLIKIPTIYMLIPILFMIFHKDRWKMFTRPAYYLYGVLSITPAFYWYFLHTKIFPENTIVDKEIMGLYYSASAWEYYFSLMKQPKTWSMIYLRSIGEYHLGISVFLFFLGGVFIMFKKFKDSLSLRFFIYDSKIWMFFYWFLGFNLFILAFIAPNLAHEYYQLPIILPCMAIASYYIYNIFIYINQLSPSPKKYIIQYFHIILLIVLIPFLITKLKSRLEQDFFYNSFAEKIKLNVSKDDLIIVADNTPRTEVFYFADRKGFQYIIPGAFQMLLTTVPIDYQKTYFKQIEWYRRKGAKYFVTPYVELPAFLPWLYKHLSENYTCVEGCDIDEKRSIVRDKTIPGFIFDLTKPKEKP
jgi:4-amino-4-deoxy-L-arabinose transferase-like glycosyltransferase